MNSCQVTSDDRDASNKALPTRKVSSSQTFRKALSALMKTENSSFTEEPTAWTSTVGEEYGNSSQRITASPLLQTSLNSSDTSHTLTHDKVAINTTSDYDYGDANAYLLDYGNNTLFGPHDEGGTEGAEDLGHNQQIFISRPSQEHSWWENSEFLFVFLLNILAMSTIILLI